MAATKHYQFFLYTYLVLSTLSPALNAESVFVEDWEGGTIDPSIWTSWGSPSPFLSSPGADGAGFALDPNGDGFCDSGLISTIQFRLRDLTIEWTAREQLFGVNFQDIEVGIAKGPLPITATCHNQGFEKHTSIRLGGRHRRLEFWVNQTLSGTAPFDDTGWHQYKMHIKETGSVAFYLDGVLLHETEEKLDLEAHPTGKLLLGGRSISSPSLIDDISVTSSNTLIFSGQEWTIRKGGGDPGNGCWTSSPESVWVDSQGRLHLKIRVIDGQWCQVEVSATNPARFGEHAFLLNTDMSTLDPRVVFGAFIIKKEEMSGGNCSASPCPEVDGECVCEIDVEITGGFDEAQCNSAPPEKGIQIFNIVTPSSSESCKWFGWNFSATQTTHAFDWTSDSVVFKNSTGHCSSTATCSGDIGIFSYPLPGVSSFVPPEEENLIPVINLWICTGANCEGNGAVSTEQEVIVSQYINPIFTDGFESGNTSAWTTTTP